MDLHRAAAIVCSILAYILRASAIALGFLTVILCFPGIGGRLNLTGLVIDITQALPDVISGYGLITSPFGGVFRFDFALVMVVLLVADYVLIRISHAIR